MGTPPGDFKYDLLIDLFRERHFLLTAHASSRAVEREIDVNEIVAAILSGEMIEDYPGDKYGPSCLVRGTTNKQRILHVHISYPPQVKVITVYEPDPAEWDDEGKTRKR